MKHLLDRNSVRRFLVIPPIAIGIFVLAWFRSNAREPQRRPEVEEARVLRVIKVPRCNVVPRVVAHGTARPGQIWRAVSEVRGRVTKVHAELRAGSIVRAGEEILQLDRTEYDLTVTQLSADIAQAEAQLAELSAREANDESSLAIEKKVLTLAKEEETRLRMLAKVEAATQASLDAQARQTLGQQQQVQALENSLNLAPSKRDALNATIAAKQAGLKQAQIDASRTTIVAPFDCRLADVSIDVGQFLAAGEALFEAHSTANAEVEAQVPVDQASTLIVPRDSPLGAELPSMNDVRNIFRIQARVTNATGSDAASWEAKFLRVRETIDANTRTVGIVVGVDRPYEMVIPGRRPPLLDGTFCRVTLTGEPRAGQIVVPRSAIHDGAIHVVDSGSRLRRREIVVQFAQGSFAVVSRGLQSGETLVVSDAAPAVDGMLVRAKTDHAQLDELIAEATAEATKRSTRDRSDD
jgi:membrane fusion protein, multidrug efflux system